MRPTEVPGESEPTEVPTEVPGESPQRLLTWRLYDVYSLLDSGRNAVRSWKVLNTVRLDSFPSIGSELGELQRRVRADL